MLFNGQNKKIRDARYFLKESRENIDEGVLDFFKKEKSDEEFRKESLSFLKEFFSENSLEKLNKFYSFKDKEGDSPFGHNRVDFIERIKAYGEVGGEFSVDLRDLESFIRNDINKWLISFVYEGIAEITISCQYKNPRNKEQKQMCSIRFIDNTVEPSIEIEKESDNPSQLRRELALIIGGDLDKTIKRMEFKYQNWKENEDEKEIRRKEDQKKRYNADRPQIKLFKDPEPQWKPGEFDTRDFGSR